MNVTLEDLLCMRVETDNGVKYTPDFRVAVQEVLPDGVRIIVHALGHNSSTLDFVVKGNVLSHIPLAFGYPGQTKLRDKP